jgi:hypothetical protein
MAPCGLLMRVIPPCTDMVLHHRVRPQPRGSLLDVSPAQVRRWEGFNGSCGRLLDTRDCRVSAPFFFATLLREHRLVALVCLDNDWNTPPEIFLLLLSHRRCLPCRSNTVRPLEPTRCCCDPSSPLAVVAPPRAHSLLLRPLGGPLDVVAPPRAHSLLLRPLGGPLAVIAPPRAHSLLLRPNGQRSMSLRLLDPPSFTALHSIIGH